MILPTAGEATLWSIALLKWWGDCKPSPHFATLDTVQLAGYINVVGTK